MKKLKPILLSTLMSLSLIVAMATPVVAQDPRGTVCDQVSQIDPSCNTGQDRIFGPGGLVADIINVLTFVAGAVAVVIIIVAGLMYVFSGGDPQNTQRAKDAILYAVIGLVITIVARVVVNFVIGRI